MRGWPLLHRWWAWRRYGRSKGCGNTGCGDCTECPHEGRLEASVGLLGPGALGDRLDGRLAARSCALGNWLFSLGRVVFGLHPWNWRRRGAVSGTGGRLTLGAGAGALARLSAFGTFSTGTLGAGGGGGSKRQAGARCCERLGRNAGGGLSAGAGAGGACLPHLLNAVRRHSMASS